MIKYGNKQFPTQIWNLQPRFQIIIKFHFSCMYINKSIIEELQALQQSFQSTRENLDRWKSTLTLE